MKKNKLNRFKRALSRFWGLTINHLDRKVLTLFLVFGIVFSGYIIRLALLEKEPEWSAVAGSMAVITAIIAAWSALLNTWRQVDTENPLLFVQFDTSSRNGLIQIELKNKGQSPAYSVFIDWDTTNPLKDCEGKVIDIYPGYRTIKVLNPNESIKTLVGATDRIFEVFKDEELEYRGTIKYKKKLAALRTFTEKFYVTLAPYRKTLYYDEELYVTHHEIQKLPQNLLRVEQAIGKLTKAIEKMKSGSN